MIILLPVPNAALRTGYFQTCKGAEIIVNRHRNSRLY